MTNPADMIKQELIGSIIKNLRKEVASRQEIHNGPLTDEELNKIKDEVIGTYICILNEEDIKSINREILAINPTKIAFPYIIKEHSYNDNWFPAYEQLNKKWNYWAFYSEELVDSNSEKSNYYVSIDDASTKILKLSGNPDSEEIWPRKGLVVGEVQAGKTSNYLAVMSKAADLGYKVFIVLAGTTERLRKQTQERIDFSFRPKDPLQIAKPTKLTSVKLDFNINTANGTEVSFSSAKTSSPILFVVKKNKTVLSTLRKWISEKNKKNDDFKNIALMLIDDEADNASVNTKISKDNATAINTEIRKILHLFPKSSYIGYTATPFANIFIEFDENKDKDTDLFPRDYIVYLEPPSNYIGIKKLFYEKNNNLIIIKDHGKDEKKDNDKILCVKHSSTYKVTALPESLKDAICLFILVCVLRKIRGQDKKHNSMLINISPFNNVQKSVFKVVEDYLKNELKNDVEVNIYNLAYAQGTPLARLKYLYYKEYASSMHNLSWNTIKKYIPDYCEKIQIELINQTKSSKCRLSHDILNYNAHKEGYNVIAIGGYTLSRGLTLEGLSISYVLRNTIMYDALLQMGRWFGYRDNYSDLCRIFLSDDAIKWYSYVTMSTLEVYNEFKEMDAIKATPAEFGLKIREDNDALIITSANKMRNSDSFILSADLSGKIKESYSVYISGENLISNQKLVKDFIISLYNRYNNTSLLNQHYIWKNVHINEIEKFLRKFYMPINYTQAHKLAILRYIDFLKTKENHNFFNVVLASRSNGKNVRSLSINNDITINCVLRSFEKTFENDSAVEITRRRVLTGYGQDENDISGSEVIDFTENEKDTVANLIIKSNFSKTEAIRSVRQIPVLILMFAELRLGNYRDHLQDQKLYKNIPLFAIVFPKQKTIKRERIEYKVNKVYLSNLYSENDLTNNYDAGDD